MGEFVQYAADLVAIPEKFIARDATLYVDAVHLLQVLLEALLAAGVQSPALLSVQQQPAILELQLLQAGAVTVSLAVQGL